MLRNSNYFYILPLRLIRYFFFFFFAKVYIIEGIVFWNGSTFLVIKSINQGFLYFFFRYGFWPAVKKIVYLTAVALGIWVERVQMHPMYKFWRCGWNLSGASKVFGWAWPAAQTRLLPCKTTTKPDLPRINLIVPFIHIPFPQKRTWTHQ